MCVSVYVCLQVHAHMCAQVCVPLYICGSQRKLLSVILYLFSLWFITLNQGILLNLGLCQLGYQSAIWGSS